VGGCWQVKEINPAAKMVLRILTDDSKSVCRFGTKFGAHLPTTAGLLQTARDLGLDVVGVSFHVGSGEPPQAGIAGRGPAALTPSTPSPTPLTTWCRHHPTPRAGCRDPMAYDDAVRRAKRVFEEGAALGFAMTLLDVGGGFPGSEKGLAVAGEELDIHGMHGLAFEQIAAVLGPALDEVFPDRSIRVIAEPGR
jgi:ornithine decarboxylase